MSISIIIIFARAISKTAQPIFTKSSRRWQIGCNRKVRLLVYSFGVGESFKKVTLASDPASQNANKAAKWIYSSKKGSCLILAG